MIKKIAISLLIVLSIIGCNKSEETAPKIEIYFPVERIISKDGSDLIREWNFWEKDTNDSWSIEANKLLHKYARYDTINHNYIYAGSFKANKNDLQELPFISDEEIISFNFKTSHIELSPSAVEKLWEINSDALYSRQFIITADLNPILTGYFYSVESSSTVQHFYIVNRSRSYWDWSWENKRAEFVDNEFFKIEYNANSKDFGFFTEYDFKKEIEFYNAFKSSGRIAE